MSSLAAVNSQMNYVTVWRRACRIVQWTLTEKVHIGWIHCEKSTSSMFNIFYMYINIVHKYIMRVVLRLPFVFPLSKTTVLITSRLLVLYQRDRLASYTKLIIWFSRVLFTHAPSDIARATKVCNSPKDFQYTEWNSSSLHLPPRVWIIQNQHPMRDFLYKFWSYIRNVERFSG